MSTTACCTTHTHTHDWCRESKSETYRTWAVCSPSLLTASNPMMFVIWAPKLQRYGLEYAGTRSTGMGLYRVVYVHVEESLSTLHALSQPVHTQHTRIWSSAPDTSVAMGRRYRVFCFFCFQTLCHVKTIVLHPDFSLILSFRSGK